MREAQEIDLKEGGVVTFADGRTVTIPPNPYREHISVFPNLTMEFMFYPLSLIGEDPSDRIHMLITFSDGSRQGLLMNGEDATTIIRGLAVCLQRAIDEEIPLKPE